MNPSNRLSLYQFEPRQIILPDPNDAYFIRAKEAYINDKNDNHNPEWYIQAKIRDNKDGYFDFSKSMIDIGACYGVYTWCLPFAFSYMFEPNKEYFAYMNANALLHDRIWSTIMYNLAVSDYDGFIQFDGFNSGYYANPNGNTWADFKCENVRCVRLDDNVELFQNIGFIKIDIEGQEPAALRGMEEVIRKNSYPPILFESWPAPKPGIFYESRYTETQEEYEKRIDELINILIDVLGYTIIWGYGDDDTHLAIHQ